MFTLKKKVILFCVLILITSFGFCDNPVFDDGYFKDRSYFVLRSGDIKMVLQSDKVNVLPAFTYLLFDANNIGQTRRKHKAFNYNSENGYLSSALSVKMKDYWYTALGQHCKTRWVLCDNIPSVEAVWWAGGIKVCEVISPVSNRGIFKRNITLYSANIVNEDSVSIKLCLPAAASLAKENVILLNQENFNMSVVLPDSIPVSLSKTKGTIITKSFALKPGEKKEIESYLIVNTIQNSDNNDLFEFAKKVNEYCKGDLDKMAYRWKQSNKVFTNDTLVKDIFDASRFILPNYISKSGKMDAGIFEYGAQWVRDASLTTIGLIHCGEFELAKASLKNMLDNMITDNGTTMIASGFDAPDREQFDQMGEFIHCLKSYVNWSGDISLLEEYREKILAMIERPLNPVFRDSTGMVHNRREFWERTFDDAYELAYQVWIIQGLRDAADLALYLEVPTKAKEWRKQADIFLNATLNHPDMKLVDNGHFIKRRNITGEIADTVILEAGIGKPAHEEYLSRLMPDATLSLPISLNLIDPKSDISKKTLKLLEQLKNQRWDSGGYDRYHTSSQLDMPGPWSFASTFIMRAQHEAGLSALSRNTLEWLYNVAGGTTGAFYEVIPIIGGQEKATGILPWTSGEITYFVIHHVLGLKFQGNNLTIKPALYDEMLPLKADLRYRKGRINIEIKRKGSMRYALINGKKIKPSDNGEITVPDSFTEGNITIF